MLLNTENKEYYDLIDSKHISWDFYKQYIEKEPNFGQLGLIVFVRTYSRYIPYDWANKYYKEGMDYEELLRKVPKELRRREKWCETVLRVVDYLMSLYPELNNTYKEGNEAEDLYNRIFSLKLFPAGRTLWTGGTLAVNKSPTASFNCSFACIDSISAIAEGFYLLLVGAGFGFSLEEKYLSKLPRLYRDKHILGTYDSKDTLFKNKKLGNSLNKDNTYLFFSDVRDFILEPNTYRDCKVKDASHFYVSSDTLCLSTINELFLDTHQDIATLNILVGDSKEGWVNALKAYLLAYTIPNLKNIAIHYGNIRKQGERLKTFGGRSSGAGALEELFDYITWVVNEEYKNPSRYNKDMSSVSWLDIINAMGKAVVVGGVRRSSEIALGDMWDTAFTNAKKDIWITDPEKAKVRAMSNNSVVLREKPTLDWFKNALIPIKTNGEPGFYCLDVANKRLKKYLESIGISYDYYLLEFERKGTNPCGEILLANKGVCNLTEVNVVGHLYKNTINFSDLLKSVRLATRIGTRITSLKLFHPEWRAVNERDRLLGVSLTGIVEACNSWAEEYKNELSSGVFELEEYYKLLFEECRTAAREEADECHSYLGIPSSLLVTTIKPSGSLSQLPTVSSGIHAPYAPFYLRRVTISVDDPLCTCLIDLGVPNEPKNGEEDKSVIFTFPIKTSATVRAIDEPALVQLERYKSSMDYYTEHNTSCTITVADDEWDSVAQWLYNNYGSWIGLSFLPRFDPAENKTIYPQMPYETCTEEQYLEMKEKVPQLKEQELLEILAKYESDYLEYELDAECSTGSCPVR